MDKNYNTNWSEITVVGNALYNEGKVVIETPTEILELARLDDSLFIILQPENMSGDPYYAGTNLWSLDLGGKILWKAPNLNECSDEKNKKLCGYYSDMNIFDLTCPKIKCYVNDRWSPCLDAKTGAYIDIYDGIDWTHYSEAWPKFAKIQKTIEASIFLKSKRTALSICEDASN